MKLQELKNKLELVHRQFVDNGEIQNDAIAPALRYSNSIDREFAAFICAVLAYGRVEQIKKSIDRILIPLGKTPVINLAQLSKAEIKKTYKGWVHRFNSDSDIVSLLLLMRDVYKVYGSIEEFWALSLESYLRKNPSQSRDSFAILESFAEGLELFALENDLLLPPRSASFWFLLTRPSSGSACKRLSLYLRWMVGRSEMDFSLWKTFHTRDLLIPLDTHILKQAQKLQLTKRKSGGWKTAVEVTEKLKLLDPEDPTRFDFALCHLGMKGQYGRKGMANG